jgi:hypothetical protein
VSEAEFQQQVIDYAHLRGWRVAHFRKVRVQRKNGSVYWETPVAADGKGFPDLILVKDHGVIAAELKVGRNKPSPEQMSWLTDLENAGVAVFVWTPDNWQDIEETLR